MYKHCMVPASLREKEGVIQSILMLAWKAMMASGWEMILPLFPCEISDLRGCKYGRTSNTDVLCMSLAASPLFVCFSSFDHLSFKF